MESILVGLHLDHDQPGPRRGGQNGTNVPDFQVGERFRPGGVRVVG